MKIDEWSVQDAIASGDFSRMLPILIEHYGVGRIANWADTKNEHPIDCTICTYIRPWLQQQMDAHEDTDLPP